MTRQNSVPAARGWETYKSLFLRVQHPLVRVRYRQGTILTGAVAQVLSAGQAEAEVEIVSSMNAVRHVQRAIEMLQGRDITDGCNGPSAEH